MTITPSNTGSKVHAVSNRTGVNGSIWSPGVAQAWPAFESRLPALALHAGRWAADLAARADLASQLVDFSDNVLR